MLMPRKAWMVGLRPIGVKIAAPVAASSWPGLSGIGVKISLEFTAIGSDLSTDAKLFCDF